MKPKATIYTRHLLSLVTSNTHSPHSRLCDEDSVCGADVFVSACARLHEHRYIPTDFLVPLEQMCVTACVRR